MCGEFSAFRGTYLRTGIHHVGGGISVSWFLLGIGDSLTVVESRNLSERGQMMQQQAVTSAVQHQQQGGQGGSPPPLVKLVDLRPSANSNVNTEFIILEKGQPSRVSEGGPMVCVALVADSTAAAHLQLWGNECEAFQPSDIIRLTNGLFSYHKSNMVLRAGKKGTMEKIGGFSMVFVESPNMSRLQWVQDPNSKMWMPVGLGQQSSGALLRNPGSGGMYYERY